MVHKRDSSELGNLDLPEKTKRKLQDDEDEGHVDESVGTGPEITDDSGEQSNEGPTHEVPSAEAESDEGQLSRHLAQAIYNGRAKKMQQRVIDYVVGMRNAPTPRFEEFANFLRASFPSAKADVVAEEWETINRFFEEDNTLAHLAIAELIDVSEFVAAFKATSTPDEQPTNVASMPPPPPPQRMTPSPARSGSSRRGSLTSVNDSSSSGSSSSGSIKRLTPAQVASMRARFKASFDDFEGDDWVLPSGAVFDTVLYESVKDLQYECPLHSFVIEDTAGILDLFPDTRDQAELKKVLVERKDEGLVELSSAEEALLGLYNKSPEELEELFAQTSWRTLGASLSERPSAGFERLVYECLQQLLRVYRGHSMTIPQAAPESWVTNCLWGFLANAFQCPRQTNFYPGEYHSQASTYRRNLDRPRDVRQYAGHKVDGVVITTGDEFELLVIEAAKEDGGPNTTKALDDRMKLCKVTKDMHDFIRGKMPSNVRGRLVVYAMQMSGRTSTVFSLKQRRGRFYQLCHEGNVSLPSLWTGRVRTKRVLEVLAKVLSLRKALLAAAEDVDEWMADTGGNSHPTDSDVDYFAATMKSP